MIASPFQKAYEFEERYGIERLKITIQKAETAYKTYEPETIGLCKNILESICKAILEEKDEIYSDKENTQALVGKTLGLLDINSQISGGLCNIVGGCSQIAKGIGEMRNDKCITGHGATNKKPLPTKTDIEICVYTVLHIIDVIYSVVTKEEIDITKTQIGFEKIDEIIKNKYVNQYIDNNVNVEYENENLFINGAEFRPSEILYNLDRVTYDAIHKECLSILSNDYNYYLADQIVESFTSEPLEDSHMIENTCFANIHNIEIKELNEIITKGCIHWEEYEPDPSIEDLVKVDCSAEFLATFNYEYNESDEEFIYTLESFELK